MPPVSIRQGQLRRASQEAEWEVGASLQPTELSEERKAAIILFFSLLDERQRRLYAGLEAHRRGHGGDRQIADFLGLDVHTVARGAASCSGARWNGDGFARRAAGASPRKKNTAVIEQIAHLLEHETAGDPIKDLKWRRRATRKIAQQLRRLKIRVSASTVRRLLKQMGYSLRVNHKKLESGNKNPPPRQVLNQQFAYIERQRKQFLAQGNPIISVDAKKKEMIGNFKNPGACWEKRPQLVLDHDFRSDAKGLAVPYGIYDPARNQGFVVVGTSHETPAFAVEAVTLWWKSYGQRRYGRAKQLLILADSGGSNSARSRGWRYHLQQKLVTCADQA